MATGGGPPAMDSNSLPAHMREYLEILFEIDGPVLDGLNSGAVSAVADRYNYHFSQY